MKARISNQLICPVSSETVNVGVVRITALITSLGYFLFIFNHLWFLPLFFSVDFFIRGFTKMNFSPLSWLGFQINKQVVFANEKTNKAPKIFAARIGFFLSFFVIVAILLNWWVAAIVIASLITLFAFLEAAFSFCMGCYIYTYLVVPFFSKN